MHSGGFDLTKLTYIPGSRITGYATGATDYITVGWVRQAR